MNLKSNKQIPNTLKVKPWFGIGSHSTTDECGCFLRSFISGEKAPGDVRSWTSI